MYRILIIRSSSFGDIVMASALLKPLQQHWPEARIDWVLEPAYAGLLRHHPAIDRLVVWPKTVWKAALKSKDVRTLWQQAQSFSKQLRARRYDLVIDAQGLLRTRLMARLAKAGCRTGLDSREPGRFLMNRVVGWDRDDVHISSEYGCLLKALGIDPTALQPDIHLGTDDLTAAAKTLFDAKIQGPFAVLCPFTTRPQKHWIFGRWAALASALFHRYHLKSVVLGGPADADPAQTLVKKAGEVPVSLAGRLSYAQSSAVIARSALVIGVDTGLVHMGVALDKPTLALFGATRPYLTAPGPELRVIYHPRHCSPCRRRPTCNGAYDCMRDITVDQVLLETEKRVQEGLIVLK